MALKLLCDAESIQFLKKQGCTTRKIGDFEEMPRSVTVKGIDSFKLMPHKWPHPIAIIGAGYRGLKTSLLYIRQGNTNIVGFDRNEIFGGYCWITGANKTSKLQTEFGSFHVWWGPDMADSGKVYYPDCNNEWSIWPSKLEIQKHFHYAAETFGVLPHVRFECNVSKMVIAGGKDDENRTYVLTVDSLKGGETEEVPVSIIYNYPGSLTQNRIINYPGEDLFDGEIRYGMNDDTPYEALADTNVAVLGNGAFAVENARTCMECGTNKVFLVTRRKNLASPRIPSWFVHQGPIPTPGGMVLKMFEPMYELVGMGDPWKYWSVHTNSERTNVNIIQNSRFGIGDVTFLMVAWGILEYCEAVVKRFSRHTVHLSTGRKLPGVTVVLKALGLLGDYSVDRLHNMKEMVGPFCGGDWRRLLMIDATGMNAANFTTFSTGIGTTDFAITYKFLHDFPKEFYRLQGMGLMQALPRHKEEPKIEKPAYVTDVKFAMSGGIILESMCPKITMLKTGFSEYKYKMYHYAHGTDRVLEVCTGEWDKYQEDWKAKGHVHDYVPYPYTKDMIRGFFEKYTEQLQVPISVDGPGR
uniref:FAD/NAD(P)-binding domain-containing protein n=1 Tax=Alexandrium catenella TaxID=2925 RepID=A0A7S1LJF9_ALECA